MPRQEKPRLSELENSVMSILWHRGCVTAEVVRTELAPAQSLKDSTVRTILRRLEAKGYVSHETQGRTFVYVPTAASRTVAADAVRGIINRFCNGSLEDLLVGMVDGEIVSPQRLEELARRIASRTGAASDASKSSGRTRKKRGT